MGSGGSTGYVGEREPPLHPLYQVPKGNSNPIVTQLGTFQKTFCEMYDKEGGGKNYEKISQRNQANNQNILASRKLWVGCSPTPDLESLIIAVTDLRDRYYEKVLSQKSLTDMVRFLIIILFLTLCPIVEITNNNKTCCSFIKLFPNRKTPWVRN